MPTVRIVEEGTNLQDRRLITVVVSPDTNLFKADEDRLPLFAGWSNPSGDTLLQYESQYIRPRQNGEDGKAFIKRLQEYATKIRDLNQWYMTLLSRDEEEDVIVLDQMEMLNALTPERFAYVCDNFGLFEYFPPGYVSTVDNVATIVKSFSVDPEQRGSSALHRQPLRGVRSIDPLGIEIPVELNGFGITIQTWDYATVRVAYFNGHFYFYESLFSDAREDGTSNINEFQNPFFMDDWTRLTRQRQR
jgi:hypothetical protein